MAERAVVSVVRCDAEANDAKVSSQLARAADLMGGVAEMFQGKHKVYIKSNLGITDVRIHAGRQVALADAAVVRATVELIRRYYDGEIILGDASTGMPCREVFEAIGLDRALAGLDVRQVELNDGLFEEWTVPEVPAMFSRYSFSEELKDVDAVVSQEPFWYDPVSGLWHPAPLPPRGDSAASGSRRRWSDLSARAQRRRRAGVSGWAGMGRCAGPDERAHRRE
jgi:hypothetical protein